MKVGPTHRPTPPRLAVWLVGWRLSADRREFVLGDLEEEFEAQVTTAGLREARRWYWRQAWRTAFGRHPRLLLPPGPERPRRPHAIAPIAQDLRYGLRLLRRQPGFAIAAILTLALGIGANMAVFRVAWQVILKPLPYPNADRIVRVWEAYQRNGRDLLNVVSPGNYLDWQRDTHVFDAFAAYNGMRYTADLTGAGDPTQLDVRTVTADYFSVFGMTPLLGRTLGATDMQPDAPAAAVVSEGLWRQRFGADRHIVGRTIHLTGGLYTVVGVMPAAFGITAGSTIDAWLAMGFSPAEETMHGAHFLGIVARLKPRVTLEQARSEVKVAARRDSVAFPDTNKDTSATVMSIESERGGTLRSAVALLAAAAGLVLLIACANLAGLQLARGLARSREFEIRSALGASRGRLVLQLLVEACIVGALGAAAGLAASSWSLGILARVAPPALQAGTTAGIDRTALACASGLAIVSVALFALLPAWRAARAGGGTAERTATGDRQTATARTALVVAQLALAVVLLVSATLTITSLARVLRVDPGFQASDVLTFDASLPATRYPTHEARQMLFERLFRALQGIPGVTAVCGISAIPFDQPFNMTYVPEGQTAPIGAYPRTVTPGCFETLGIRLLAGRLFADHEATRVGLVTERFAYLAWGASDPIGRRVHVGVATGDVVEIVGVVKDSLQSSLEARTYPQFYEAASTPNTFPIQSVLVRASVPPGSLFKAVREAVRRIDPDQTVARLRSLDDVVGRWLFERQFDLSLFAAFAAIALVLSAVGIYGLLAQVVANRRPEIAIRLALGARPATVIGLILRRAWLAVSLGLAIGLAGAYGASSLLSRFTFQLSPTDPRIYAVVAVVLGAVALVAAWIPSHRAARVDPVAVLRDV